MKKNCNYPKLVVFNVDNNVIAASKVNGCRPMGVCVDGEKFTVIQVERTANREDAPFGLLSDGNFVEYRFCTFRKLIDWVETHKHEAYVFESEKESSDWRWEQ